MSDRSINAYDKVANASSIWVWFVGSGTAQTLYVGQGVCYDSDYGTATDADARRYNRVELPSSDNKSHFAGVLARDYSVPATGRLVEVHVPGSVCIVRLKVGESTVNVDETDLICTYTSGLFKGGGSAAGKGCARALQTVTGNAAALPCLALLEEGVRVDVTTD